MKHLLTIAAIGAALVIAAPAWAQGPRTSSSTHIAQPAPPPPPPPPAPHAHLTAKQLNEQELMRLTAPPPPPPPPAPMPHTGPKTSGKGG